MLFLIVFSRFCPDGSEGRRGDLEAYIERRGEGAARQRADVMGTGRQPR